MQQSTENAPATVPEQPEPKPPLRKGMPVVVALIVILGLIGLANVSSLLSGNKKTAPASTIPMRPATPNAQQVRGFEAQQQLETERDAEDRKRQQEIAAAIEQFQNAQVDPSPEAGSAPLMTAAQRAAIYGDSSNAPMRTSEANQARAEEKQRELAKEKQHMDAINSDTLAIAFERAPTMASSSSVAAAPVASETSTPAGANLAANSASGASQGVLGVARNPGLAPYEFDSYDGRLYRVFEGTVLEGVVTNHVDGGFSGPILVDLTTDLYSHDHQQLLLPQGTRLLGDVESVGNAQQRKMFVTFHRANLPGRVLD